MSNLPRPPAHIEPFIRVLGVEEGIRFLLRFGGAELYLTQTPNGRSALAQEFGLENAKLLAEVAEQLPRRIPIGKEWIANVWSEQGLSDADIARRLHVTDVTIRSWRRKAPFRGIRKAKAKAVDDRQIPLI